MIKKSEATADDHPKLTVIEGGKAEPIPKSGGGSTPPTDYVSEMTVGTTFLARPRKVNTFVLIEFSVTDVGQNSIRTKVFTFLGRARNVVPTVISDT